MLLRLDSIEKHIGGRVLFSDVGLVVRAGDRIGLVGPNGAGKSTLLRIAAGDEVADAGTVSVPKQVEIGVLRQEIDPSQSRSVREEAGSALARLDALEEELRDLEAKMTEAGQAGREIPAAVSERYDRASADFEHGGGFERAARVSSVLAGLGFDDEACDRPLSSFSGGWIMRVELAKLLLGDPDVLLLDEPTNHLDLPSIQWFEETLANYRGAVVTVSHDRTFLRRHVDRVAELDGVGRFTMYEGNYDEYLSQRVLRREELEARKANQDREIAQMERFVERFRAKATKARQAQSRVKALEKIDRVVLEPDRKRSMRLRIPAPPRSGQVVVALEDIAKSYGDQTVYEGVGLEVRRGDKLALVGPNGAGKSTLLRIIAGTLSYDAGERTLGHNVRAAFYAQHQLEALRPELTILEELERDAEMADTPRLRGHLGAFLFSGEDVDKRVSVLSGGEKARVALAKLLLHPSNLLVLDEPTNHLDIEACEVLEEALAVFEGTVVLVSHDRSFINKIATRVVEVVDGHLGEYIGNYDDYLRKSAAERASKTPGPVAPSTAGRAEPKPAAGRKLSTGSKPRAEAKSGREAKPDPPTDRDPSAPVSSKAQRAHERTRKKKRDQLERKIEKLEEEIAASEERKEAIGWRLGDPEVFRDAEQVRALTNDRAGLQAAIDALYREWERLADELQAVNDAIEP